MEENELINQYCKVKGHKEDFIIQGFSGNKVLVLPVNADIMWLQKVNKKDIRIFRWKMIREYFN